MIDVTYNSKPACTVSVKGAITSVFEMHTRRNWAVFMMTRLSKKYLENGSLPRVV